MYVYVYKVIMSNFSLIINEYIIKSRLLLSRKQENRRIGPPLLLIALLIEGIFYYHYDTLDERWMQQMNAAGAEETIGWSWCTFDSCILSYYSGIIGPVLKLAQIHKKMRFIQMLSEDNINLGITLRIIIIVTFIIYEFWMREK